MLFDFSFIFYFPCFSFLSFSASFSLYWQPAKLCPRLARLSLACGLSLAVIRARQSMKEEEKRKKNVIQFYFIFA